MNTKLLVDGIVRQTTILIAQVSTAAGIRAPLAHIADQVFLDLAREIPFEFERTYDILPASPSGVYFADGVPVGSTLLRH